MLQLINYYSGAELFIVAVAYLLAVLIAITFHELAHAYVAVKQGDMTPKIQGRLTFNPLQHIDAIGFLMLFLVGFGWAKPVQVNPMQFRNYKKGSVLVSIAGVTVNFILAFISYPIFLLLFSYGAALPTNLSLFLSKFFEIMLQINLVLVVFNLLPIYPLDGFRLVEANASYNNKYVQFMRRNGALVLLCVLITLQVFDFLSYFTFIIGTPIALFWNVIFGIL